MGVSIRNQILYYTAVFGCIKKTYLVAFSGNNNTAYRELKDMVHKEYIHERQTYEYVNSRRKVVRYFCITKKGLLALAQMGNKLSEEMKWTTRLSEESKDVRLIKDRTLSQRERLLRFLSISGCASFASQAGCAVKSIILDEHSEDEQIFLLRFFDADWENEVESSSPKGARQKTILTVINNALEKANEGREQKNNGNIANFNSDKRFISAYEMKRLIAKNQNGSDTLREGRYTGMLVSPFESVLLFEGKRSGMSWSRWMVEADLRSYHIYARLNPSVPTPRVGHDVGAMLVTNAKMLEDLILDRRGKQKSGEFFGNGFSAFYIFPITKIGTENLNAFLNVDIAAHQQEVITAALYSEIFRENKGPYAAEFPLVNRNGTEMAIGTFIDAIQVQRILRLRKRLQKPIGLICYEWQKDYYCRVLPGDTQFMTLQ